MAETIITNIQTELIADIRGVEHSVSAGKQNDGRYRAFMFDKFLRQLVIVAPDGGSRTRDEALEFARVNIPAGLCGAVPSTICPHCGKYSNEKKAADV